MKRVIFTYHCDFEEDVSDEVAIESTCEVMSQDGHWHANQFRIEIIPGNP